MFCVFCAIAAGEAPAAIVADWGQVLAIVPLGPVTAGHVLVLPRVHVPDVAADPAVSAAVMARAAVLAAEYPAVNVITSRGAAATQTVSHLHLHVVPRRDDDGLALPWSAPAAPSGRPGIP
ncbi:HIT family protein [Actinomadura hibisca]|uniref:HIT family protein n=1 Tax=Actinomadura hibisca TaxID=68565 RepID=UPI0009FF3F60|nr:HIT domain-containing protein [Actinomadura hibisca]